MLHFLVKHLFNTVNLVRPVTVYNIKSVYSAHIRRVFPCPPCTRCIHRYFSYQGRENVTSFPLPSLNLIFSPRTRAHLSPLTSKFDLSLRPSCPSGNSSPQNFQQVAVIK